MKLEFKIGDVALYDGFEVKIVYLDLIDEEYPYLVKYLDDTHPGAYGRAHLGLCIPDNLVDTHKADDWARVENLKPAVMYNLKKLFKEDNDE